jgi:uncharacterized protein YjbJ (UPF0337 family)
VLSPRRLAGVRLLTDDDLARVVGKRDEIEGLIQERCGKSKDDVRREVDDWLNRI